jgi:CDP-glycerol glycerophosphotransferase (TagB/SpsB family)
VYEVYDGVLNMKLLKKLIYIIHYKIIFTILNIMPIKSNKIIFISFSGKNFSCNPKYIYNYIIKEYRDDNLDLVIALRKNSKIDIKDLSNNTRTVNYFSLKFLYELATAKYWIANTNVHPYIKPKRDVIYLQTWHAAGAFKKFGYDIKDVSDIWIDDVDYWKYLICSSSSIVDIYSKAFHINSKKVYPTGIPRNDIFFDEKACRDIKGSIIENYNLPSDKKIILYAPTFRDTGAEFKLKLNLVEMQRILGEEYILFLRLHPNIAKKVSIENQLEGFVWDFSTYNDVQELLIAADLLITDYSSLIFDFAIKGKPIIFYAYDLDYYNNELRGFYYNYETFVPGPIVYNESELIEQISDYRALQLKYRDEILAFGENFNEYFDGKASERVVKLLFSKS